MNEQNEKNIPSENCEDNTAAEAFKPEFNDLVVDIDATADENSDIVEETSNNADTSSADCAADQDRGENFAGSNEPSESKYTDTVVETAQELPNVVDEVESETPNIETFNTNTVDKPKKSKRNRRHTTRALIKESNVALILSAVSVILLVALTALLSLGILPAGNRMVYVGVSTLGPVESASGYASPELLEEFKNSVVIIDVTTATGGGTGSGIILSQDGYIVTNYHVVSGAKKINVAFYNKSEQLSAEVIGYSERDDIAVIKVNATGLRPATFANSENCRTGEIVYAVGAPEGSDFGWSITSGIISEPVREVKIYASDYVLEKKMYLLQTDAAVNPGNSGGPLINVRGEVVGIITLKRSNAAGIGFALPSSGSLELIEAIIEKGNIDGVVSSVSKSRPLIGITGVGLEPGVWYEQTEDGVRVVTEAFAQAHPSLCISTDVAGVYVTSLNPELDASNYLIEGDVITHVNGTEVYVTYDIMDIVNNFDGGDVVKVTFVRDGETYTVDITLGTED